MSDKRAEVLNRISAVMQTVFTVPQGYTVTRETSAVDVGGWDSLSHSLFILAVEDEFGVDLPLDKTYEMQNIGDLVDLISETPA
jgi:acyl carrier protein